MWGEERGSLPMGVLPRGNTRWRLRSSTGLLVWNGVDERRRGMRRRVNSDCIGVGFWPGLMNGLAVVCDVVDGVWGDRCARPGVATAGRFHLTSDGPRRLDVASPLSLNFALIARSERGGGNP